MKSSEKRLTTVRIEDKLFQEFKFQCIKDKFSFQNRVPTELDIGRSRMSRSIRQINMNEEYRKFLLVKHPKINCSPESFASLCTDAQRNKIIDASIKEAVIILKCEVRGIIQQVEKLNLDNAL